MTAELFPTTADYGLEMLIRWLIPLGGEVGPELELNSTYPFRSVSQIGGTDDKITARMVYAVDTFATGADKREAVRNVHRAAADTHSRVLLLGPPIGAQERVTLDDGRIVYADKVVTALAQHPAPHGDGQTVKRMVGHYALSLRLLPRL